MPRDMAERGGGGNGDEKRIEQKADREERQRHPDGDSGLIADANPAAPCRITKTDDPMRYFCWEHNALGERFFSKTKPSVCLYERIRALEAENARQLHEQEQIEHQLTRQRLRAEKAEGALGSMTFSRNEQLRLRMKAETRVRDLEAEIGAECWCRGPSQHMHISSDTPEHLELARNRAEFPGGCESGTGSNGGPIPVDEAEQSAQGSPSTANPAAPTWRSGVDEFAEGDYEILNREEIDWSLASLEWAVPNLLRMWERIRTLKTELTYMTKRRQEDYERFHKVVARAEKAEARIRELEKAR